MKSIFFQAPIKSEGSSVYTKEELEPYKNQVNTVYVERRVPAHLEQEVNDEIDRLLVIKGYTPEDL